MENQTPNENPQRPAFTEEFERLKGIMVAVAGGTENLIGLLRETHQIELKGKEATDYKLTCFSLKVKIAILEALSDKNEFLNEKLSYLEEAQKFANELVQTAQANNCLQPSHIKRLAVTKRKLASALNRVDIHHGRTLEAEATRLLLDLIKKNPKYGEAYLELAEIQKLKLLRELNSISRNITTAKSSLKKAQNSSRKTDLGIELDLQRIDQLENFVSQIRTN